MKPNKLTASTRQINPDTNDLNVISSADGSSIDSVHVPLDDINHEDWKPQSVTDEGGNSTGKKKITHL